MATTTSQSSHTWKFFRAGGFDQVRIDSGQDIACLHELDQKLWVALSCPVKGLEFDVKTLEMLDTDKDDRVRAPEILTATKWVSSVLKDTDVLLKSSPALPLSAINDSTPEGKTLLASAKEILKNLGKATAVEISIDDTSNTEKIFAQTLFNGDGIVPAESGDDEATRKVIADIISCLGSQTDRSGRPGINQATADKFFTELQAFADWNVKAEADAATIMPLGDQTPAAWASFQTAKAKMDDYFARCRLASFDQRALAALNRQESEYLAIAARDLTITSAEVAAFPLARVEADKPLPLTQGLNPAWADGIATFTAQVVKPLLGDKAALTETEWHAIIAKFAPYEAWLGAKAGAAVEKLGLARVRTILAGPYKTAIDALIARDKALEPEINAIAAVDKLVRLNRDLFKLLNNYVSFRDFYSKKDKATFQAGTLYLDQRSCDLCIRIEDMGKHAVMAPLSRAYLAVCECSRKLTGEKMLIGAAFTGGDSDNLMVGRNGLFYDRKGNDWDATITKIIENPISVRQAFFSPYKRAMRMIEEQINKRLAAADAQSTGTIVTAAQTVHEAGTLQPAPPAPPPPPKKMDIGVVAALGVAVGGITAALGAFLQAFFGLGIWMPLGIIAIILLISGPSMAIAWLKLRQRNLGPLLDANGWAVNAKARLNIPFGASLTGVATLPPGSKRDLTDKYADNTSGKYKLIAVLVLIAALYLSWHCGLLHKAGLRKLPKSSWMMHHDLPGTGK
jgi:hypothetical protein